MPVIDAPRIDLEVADVGPGMTGSFASRLTINPGPRPHVASACTATITRHAEVGPGEVNDTVYDVRGSMVCTDQAVSDTEDPTTIERLTFIAQISWFNN